MAASPVRNLLFYTYLTAFLGLAATAYAQRPLPTGLEDFHLPGTQDGALNPYRPPYNDAIVNPQVCSFCHFDYGSDHVADIHKDWSGSMMAQATRDPLFQACMQIANADASDVGDMCIRCHSPKGWLEGRSIPTDGALLTPDDREGVSCNFCHRLVSPFARTDEQNSPTCNACDAAIRQQLLADGNLPVQSGNGSYVVDTHDRRRGPFTDAICRQFHATEFRPTFFQDAALCGTCHDVSNPLFTRVGNDYILGPMDGDDPPPPPGGSRHPSGHTYDMFPIERTFSEWLSSAYAQPGGVDSGGRFGGNNPIVGTCQTCHLPRGRGDGVALQGCAVDGSPQRTNLPMHFFSGANAWIPDVLLNLYPNEVDADALMANKARNQAMLEAAATLQLTHEPGRIRVRVINETGHKLPSGYPEGRRMWLHVAFADCQGNLLREHGHYDAVAADLTTTDTKVYESQFGLDAAVAARAGLPVGPSFHFALNNKIYLDNRIPPRGFTNAGFAAVQAAPVGYTYADGQYWDETVFAIPPGAALASVDLYYQTASKEYIEFLRDNNPLPPDHPRNAGQLLYNQWLVTGKSAPVAMTSCALYLGTRGDLTGDGLVTTADLPRFVNVLLGNDTSACAVGAADMDGSCTTDGADIQLFIQML